MGMLGDSALNRQAEDFTLGEQQTRFIVELVPSAMSEKSAIENGPVPGQYFFLPNDGLLEGEVIIFVARGVLDFIEYARYSEEMPDEWPELSRLIPGDAEGVALR